MGLGEPQYPRKLLWWEYVGAKTNFVSWIFFISFSIVIAIVIWRSLS